MTGGRYRPMYFHSVKAGVDADGRLVGWRHRIVGQSILTGTPFEAMVVAKGVDGTSVEGASNLAYAVPHIAVDLVTTTIGVPVLWWRSVGHTHTAYATEVMIDALAAAAGKDPVEFRLALMQDHPRHAGVLRLAAEKAGWTTPLPEGPLPRRRGPRGRSIPSWPRSQRSRWTIRGGRRSSASCAPSTAEWRSIRT